MLEDDQTQGCALRRLFKLTLEPTVWRHELLQLGLLVGLALGAIVYLPSVWVAFQTQRWGIIFIDTLAIGVVAALYLTPQRSFRVRASVFALVFYVLGVWLLVEVGSISQIYLLGFSILATILLGLRTSLVTVGINAATLFGLGAVNLAAPGMLFIGREMNLSAWFVVTLNFLLVNSILTVSIGAVLSALEGIAQREYAARMELERDRTELVQANAALDHEMRERKLLETQLAQSQKLEAIGQLAGGVAHDFNNLLTVINGYSDELLSTTPATDGKRFMLEEIHAAGERAAELTRQLLAFSRKQILAPQILDLNTIVSKLEKMLRRLISEDIRVTIVLQPDLPWIQVDPGQLEQVMLNLAVNARDAMPTGGLLTIESASVVFTAEQLAHKFEIPPGAYVTLTVSDTGSGMSPEVQAHIFEPFFTTKDVGKGTGLGLATVFGIVKQSDAYIDVYSEVGIGTRFRVLFPVVNNVAQPTPPEVEALPRGSETVLLVEDEADVRGITRLALETHGYRVLEAANGREALQLYIALGHTIDLVVTDVIMPEMSGRELIEALQLRQAQVSVLYISGYTDDAIVRHGIIAATDAFLQKPFSPSALIKKVREVLDA